ncbi:hypothetical protein [Streptomyces sp. NPDC005096]|uniref:hypothetical protein n=1 Tax=Streptomyces sp. NPDC005096 TaxID=3154559 RepID=UPI0033BD621F
MQFTLAEQAAITAHAASLGIGRDDYVRRAAAERALVWQRERDGFADFAARRGTSVEDVLQRGCLTDDDLP